MQMVPSQVAELLPSDIIAVNSYYEPIIRKLEAEM